MKYILYLSVFMSFICFTSCAITDDNVEIEKVEMNSLEEQTAHFFPSWWEENLNIEGDFIYSYGIGIDETEVEASSKSIANARTELQKIRYVEIESKLTILAIKDKQFREAVISELKEQSAGTIKGSHVGRTEFIKHKDKITCYSEVKVSRYDLFPEERLHSLKKSGYKENDVNNLRIFYDNNGYSKLSLNCRKILADKSIVYKIELVDYYVKENYISLAFIEISLLHNQLESIDYEYQDIVEKKFNLIKSMLQDVSWVELVYDFEKMLKNRENLSEFNILVGKEVGKDINVQIVSNYVGYLYLYYIDFDGLYLLEIDNSYHSKCNPPGRYITLPGYGELDFTLFGIFLTKEENRLKNWKTILKKDFDSKDENDRNKAYLRFQQLIDQLKTLNFTSSKIVVK